MFRKVFLSIIFLAIFFGISPKAQAESVCTPVLSVKETNETSVKLKLTCLELKEEKVSMWLIVSNDDTEVDSYKKVSATLGKKGAVNLKISGLDSATNYSFKAKIKKKINKAYSPYSDSIDATTKSSDYEPEIEKISSVTEKFAKINFSCEDLENEKVDVQLAYKKKTSWSVKTFALTLDVDGEGLIDIDGLKSATPYSFKIKIKKDDDRLYSLYSSVKTATTDEE